MPRRTGTGACIIVPHKWAAGRIFFSFFVITDLIEEKPLARLLALGEREKKKKKKRDKPLIHGLLYRLHETKDPKIFFLTNLRYKPKPFLRCLAWNGVYRSLDRFASVEFLVQTAENDAQDCGGNDGN